MGFETHKLKQRIEELEQQLKNTESYVEMFTTLEARADYLEKRLLKYECPGSCEERKIACQHEVQTKRYREALESMRHLQTFINDRIGYSIDQLLSRYPEDS